MSCWIVSRDVPHVEVHAGHDPVPGQPEGDELAARGIAAKDDAVPRPRKAGVLHAGVVLVGEEVRQCVVRHRAVEHVERGDRALVERVVPVLDAHALAVEGMVGVGDVAGGEHAGRGGPEVLVDQDPVVDHQARVGSEPSPRLHADADDDEVALDDATVAGAHALDGPVALEGLDVCLHQHRDAVLAVEVAVDGADLGAQDPLAAERCSDR